VFNNSPMYMDTNCRMYYDQCTTIKINLIELHLNKWV